MLAPASETLGVPAGGPPCQHLNSVPLLRAGIDRAGPERDEQIGLAARDNLFDEMIRQIAERDLIFLRGVAVFLPVGGNALIVVPHQGGRELPAHIDGFGGLEQTEAPGEIPAASDEEGDDRIKGVISDRGAVEHFDERGELRSVRRPVQRAGGEGALIPEEFIGVFQFGGDRFDDFPRERADIRGAIRFRLGGPHCQPFLEPGIPLNDRRLPVFRPDGVGDRHGAGFRFFETFLLLSGQRQTPVQTNPVANHSVKCHSADPPAECPTTPMPIFWPILW